jgi:hypothetical protein
VRNIQAVYRSVGIVCALALAPACKGSDPRVDVVDPNKRDASAADGGEAGGGPGAGSGGGSSVAGSGGGSADAGPGADGGDDDAGMDPNQIDPTVRCEIAKENSLLELPVMFGSEAGFSIAPGVTGFGLAFQAGSCGQIDTMPIAANGAFPAPSMLLGSDCVRLQDVALLRVSDGWRLGFVDNASGSAELQTLLLSDALTLPGDPVRSAVTNNMLRERAPVFANIAGVPHLAWIAEDLTTGERRIERKRFDSEAKVETLLDFEAGHKPLGLAFAQLGRENAALAFVDEQGKHGIWLARLDKQAQPVGEPVLLSDFVSAGNSVDLATREEDGGAVLYSLDVGGVNHEVRFRRLDKDGAFLSDEVKIVGSPIQGRDASLARLGGGYAVAYRQLPGEGQPKSEIRLLFITKEGNVMRDSVGRLQSYPLADAAPNGGRISLRVSTDGQLLVAFLDDAGDGTKLRLVRKRLDCAL